MIINTIEYKNINETLYVYQHKSGFKAFFIPKKGYSKKYVAITTNYGSIDNAFIAPGEKDITKVPHGIAHFLEHKLFEKEDGNAMEKFSLLGSNSNAYTTFNQTAYLFSCTEKFNENLQLLLKTVQSPFFTEQGVETEKQIITQEIKMYQDNANWRVLFNFLDALYKNNPVKFDIVGTIESISEINKEILYKCYNTFYHPSNMAMIVVGDINYKELFKQIDENIKTFSASPEIKRIFPIEPHELNKKYIEQKLEISTPLFQLGFKDSIVIGKGIDSVKREVAVKLLLSMIFGKSSKLYNNLYGEGLINNHFKFDYLLDPNYAFSILGVESSDPEVVRNRIIEELDRIKYKGLNRKDFERIKRSVYGKFLQMLNSVDKITYNFISVCFKEVNMFDYLEVYNGMSYENIMEVFNNHFILNNMAFSVVNPV